MNYRVITICSKCGKRLEDKIVGEKPKNAYLNETRIFCLECFDFQYFKLFIIPIIKSIDKKKVKKPIKKNLK